MISGYNCTIFAYGQTGTGKTYTMSGDMTETMGYLSDGAGIIPRVLYALFNKLEMDEMDSAVKCSFIELYNEELRDLISAEESTKLKIYEDTSRKGHTTTVVQGMEECYIKTASEGIKILQEGSLKRQVAATKCNDLSSRSHTVFTITAYVKRSAASGDGGDDDYVSAGKLNLVDLAGSENIQRSGAENKRAAEAGLINKSLLTLGRVINALVDHSPHIPYRESKLTRLLQDSLGGRTKTCIIATISPARSNLEETISTLDYAFRAKNIRNKPQTKALISKKALLRDFASEIERLKGELIATRQRNGVYLSNEQYEAMTVEAESRRILTEEQLAKIETLESNLRNKVQELFALTSSFMGLRKEHDATRAQLDETRGLLDQTELVLATTRRSLAEETHLRMAHQETEAQLTRVGDALLGTLRRTVTDVGGLHAKDRRRSDLQSINRASWQSAQETVASATSLVESRVAAFQQLQQRHVAAVEERMRVFVRDELAALEETQRLLDERLAFLESSKRALVDGQKRALDEANETLDDVATVRDAVRESVGSSLQSIASAAQRIAADVLGELATLHTHLHESYAALGRDLRQTFEDLLGHVASQRAESDKLRHRLCAAGGDILRANDTAAARVQEVVDEERRLAADERATLMAQIAALVNAQAERQEARLAAKAAGVRTGIEEAAVTFDDELKEFGKGTEASNARDDALVLRLRESRDAIKARLQNDWNVSVLMERPKPLSFIHESILYKISKRRRAVLIETRLRTSTAPRSRRRPSRCTPRRSGSSTRR